MDLSLVLPITKSFMEMVLRCPWHAWQVKVFKVKPWVHPDAFQGLKVEHAWEGVLRHGIPLERFKLTREQQELVNIACEITPLRDQPAEWQTQHAITATGRECKWNSESAYWRGKTDRELLSAGRPKVVYVQDLKVTAKPVDNEFERVSYAFAGARRYKCNRVTMQYIYPLLGEVQSYDYEFRGALIPAEVSGPIEHLRDTPVVPTPGAHCSDWYGQPCQFAGGSCPVAEFLPDATSHLVTIRPGRDDSELLRHFTTGDHLACSKREATRVAIGVQQLEGFLRLVKKGLADYAKTNGPVHVGTAQYGWRDKDAWSVDKVKAMEILAELYDLNDLVRYINISESSLSKAHCEARELLDQEAIFYRKTRPTFGLMED